MYTWTRIAHFKNLSGMAAAMPICQSIVELLKQETGQDASLLIPTLGGHPARALFVIRSTDVKQNLDGFERASQNARYRELLKQLGEHVDGALTNDQLWKTVV